MFHSSFHSFKSSIKDYATLEASIVIFVDVVDVDDDNDENVDDDADVAVLKESFIILMGP